jgi:hypothetical protein
MTILQQVQAEYELSKYAHALCHPFLAYEQRRYLQLFRGDEAPLLVGDAALRGSLNDRVELTIARHGIVFAPLDQIEC